jgi:hypothetical protein
VIPLRIMHVLTPAVLHDRAGPASMLPWLAGQGHAVAAVAVGPGEPPAPAGLLGRRLGWWSWWRRDRAAATVAAGSWGADVIHSHGEAAIAPAIELARRLAAPVIAEPWTLAEPASLRQLRDPLVAAIIATGEEQRSALLAGTDRGRDRVALIPPGVDQALPPPRHADGSLVVGCRLRQTADARTLATTIAALRDAGLAVSARVAGPCAHAAPGCEPVAAGGELAGADVLVELCGRDLPMLHVVDALAAGRPVVAVSAGVLPELVHDGRSGALIPLRDSGALAGALRQLAAAEARATRAAAALVDARRHEAGVVGEALLGLYRAAVGGTAPGAATTWKRLSTERLRRRSDRLPRSTSSSLDRRSGPA